MDESGNENHGTVFGDTSLTDDRFGNVNYAYLFDGDDDYIDCGEGTSLDMTEAISVVAWVKTSSMDGPRIVSRQDSGAGYELTLSGDELWFVLNNDIEARGSLSGRENKWMNINSWAFR